MLQELLTETFCTRALQLILDGFVKSSLLVGLAWLLTGLVRRGSAELRSHIWNFALAGLMVLPVVSVLTPVWRLPFLPDLAELIAFFGSLGADVPAVAQPLGAPVPAGDLQPVVAMAAEPMRVEATSWRLWALLFLMAGTVVTGVWLGLSRLLLDRLVRRAEPLSGAWQPLLTSLAGDWRIGRTVRLGKTSAVKAGMTLGTWRPVILLPADADAWSTQRRRMTLSHELAHIKRCDAFVEDLAGIVTVLYWYNPLVWQALKRLRIERELDCDNRVLAAGTRPSDYARQLMEIAAEFGVRGHHTWRLTGVAETAGLRDRLLHILNPCVPRGASRRLSVFAAALLIAAIAVPLALIDPWRNALADPILDPSLLSVEARTHWDGAPAKKRDNSAAYLAEVTIANHGAEEAVEVLRDLLARPVPERTHYIEQGEINELGYRLLRAGRVDAAVAIFAFNVQANPRWWNAHDSLGEACLAAGDLERARASYRTSLRLDSQNVAGAEAALAGIETETPPAP